MNEDHVNKAFPPSSSPGTSGKPPEDLVWSYGGYRISANNFTTAMVHFYRAEIQRANVWRTRLDVTTNWAVISTGAALSFAFGDSAVHHSVILILALLITLFCVIEARRYRYYELWSYRVRLMEIDFYAAMLVPPFRPRSDWAARLSDSLLNANYPITYLQAFGHRLRRNYLWIYLIIAIAWIAKLLLYSPPNSILTLESLLSRARIGVLRGEIVFGLVGLWFAGLILLALITRSGTRSMGELQHQSDEIVRTVTQGIAEDQAVEAAKASTAPPESQP